MKQAVAFIFLLFAAACATDASAPPTTPLNGAEISARYHAMEAACRPPGVASAACKRARADLEATHRAMHESKQ